MMTITIAAITIGIAVDNSIHYIYRIKKELNKNKSLMFAINECHNTVGNAIMTTSLTIAFGFSIFSVSLRWKKNTPTFTTVAVAGLFCGTFSFFVLIFNDANFFTTFKNSSLSALHGTLVCSGMILYSIGSKHLPAADLTLLSLTEVLGGIFWVWLPIFGINEIPTANTIIGGSIITFALIYYSLNTKRNRRFIGLN